MDEDVEDMIAQMEEMAWLQAAARSAFEAAFLAPVRRARELRARRWKARMERRREEEDQRRARRYLTKDNSKYRRNQKARGES